MFVQEESESSQKLVPSSIRTVWVNFNDICIIFVISDIIISLFSVEWRHFSFYQISPRYLIQIDGTLYHINTTLFSSSSSFIFLCSYSTYQFLLFCVSHRHTNKHILQYMYSTVSLILLSLLYKNLSLILSIRGSLTLASLSGE